MSMKTPLKIFYSYSHKDEKSLDEFKDHLATLRNEGIIVDWYDQKIVAGDKLFNDIDRNLESADIIVLFVSSSYFASVSCGKEMNRAIERYESGDAQVIPVIVRPCVWQQTSLSELKVLPKDGKAVTIWDNQDLAWTNVSQEIRNAIETPGPRFLYKKLCAEGRSSLLNQTIKIAPYLDDLTRDNRFGLTLIVRPNDDVATNLIEINTRMKEIAPEHFYYDQMRFHFTILSLINATDPPKVSKDFARHFEEEIKIVLKDFYPFEIKFSGVCVTPNSIIAKGFPVDNSLEILRDKLRYRLRDAGLGAGLDERYRIEGAHITLGRFKIQEDFSPLIILLDQLQNVNIGNMYVQKAQLVINDFYMSPDKVKILAEIPLGHQDSSGVTIESKKFPTIKKIRHNLTIKPTKFLGRDNDLKYIIKALGEADKPVIITSGFGGIGKSTLAKMIAWTCIEQQSPFDFIAWIDVRQYDKSQTISFDFILNTIAKVEDINSDIPSISQIQVKKDRVKELLKSHNSLLILDNYESLLSNRDEEQKVSSFLESLPIGSTRSEDNTYIRVLITTREVSTGLRVLPIDNVELQKLSLEDSVKLMKSRTSKRLRLTETQYEQIWTILCGLPKYMQVAIDQMRTMNFEHWVKMVTDIKAPLDESENFFHDLFGHSWERFSEDFKKILLSMTHFVGEASPDALQRTSGLPERKFLNEVATASDAYIENTGTGYAIHPLTHAFCRAMLDSVEYHEFRDQSGFRFVEYFSNFTKVAHESKQPELLEREIRNIFAAAKLAEILKAWDLLIKLRSSTSTFLRIRGYWEEQKEIAQLSVLACKNTGQMEILAKCLVDDLGWLFLRFEDLDKAQKSIEEGLVIFKKLQLDEGIAQATRHLGKLALLKGLDPYYKPTVSSKIHFDKAEKQYSSSLQIREKLRQKGLDQRERIADMKLDFGRLYWLQGQMYELKARVQKKPKLLEKAIEKYQDANKISWKAMEIFEEIKSERGIAKSWGNLGNATKEMVRFFLKEKKLSDAIQCITEAHEFYERSLEIAQKIKRKDEIAHALWGLAEVYDIFADHPELHSRVGETNKILEKALDYIEESYRIYLSLGGEKDKKAIELLINQIKEKILSIQS